MSAKGHGSKGHSAKHTAKGKHNSKHSTHKKNSKHTPNHHHKPVHHKVKPHGPVNVIGAHGVHAGPVKPAGLAIGDALPVCSFEAVAMSARLAGARIHDDDVAGLWARLGERPEGVPIGDAIAGAAVFGLNGYRPAWYESLEPGLPFLAVGQRDGRAVLGLEGLDKVVNPAHALILHVDVPGPHAVLATADGWWSWGELHDPWPCRVSEAWAVSWS